MNLLRNRVQLIGNLGRDPEVNYLKSGKVVASFPLATNRSYQNAQGEKVKDTQWHNLKVWGKLAEFCEKYLRKGQEIAAEGRLEYRSYETSDGQTRYVTEILVQDILLLGSKNTQGEVASLEKA